MFTDSHCHLNKLNLQDYDGKLDNIIKDARNRGVVNLLSVATNFAELPEIMQIIENDSCIWGTVGVHPLEINQVTKVEQLIALANHKKVVGIGETGLDFYYGKDSKALQIESFIQHLLAGDQLELPIIVHTRQAKKETIQLLATHANRQHVGVLHCFTEDIDMASKALDLGFYISISGIVTFKNADELRQVAKYVPDDRLLIETDSPYLAPVPYRGKSNVPGYVVEVGCFIAELRKVSSEYLAHRTTENFFNLFAKAKKIA